MGDTRDRMGAAGVAVAGGFFKIALYVCVVRSHISSAMTFLTSMR